MKNCMIIETRDLIETRDAEWTGALAGSMARSASFVTMFLTENGVLAARAAYDAPMVRQLMKRGVKVFADRFALAERGIADRDLADGIEPADVALIAEHMCRGDMMLWR